MQRPRKASGRLLPQQQLIKKPSEGLWSGSPRHSVNKVCCPRRHGVRHDYIGAIPKSQQRTQAQKGLMPQRSQQNVTPTQDNKSNAHAKRVAKMRDGKIAVVAARKVAQDVATHCNHLCSHLCRNS